MSYTSLYRCSDGCPVDVETFDGKWAIYPRPALTMWSHAIPDAQHRHVAAVASDCRRMEFSCQKRRSSPIVSWLQMLLSTKEVINLKRRNKYDNIEYGNIS